MANLCALVNGGQQHLFFIVRVLDVDFSFFLGGGRVDGQTDGTLDPFESWSPVLGTN